jgi:type 1 glutamine amidotransferase
MRNCLPLLIALLFINFNLFAKKQEPVRILILSGRNNHNWEETTTQLKKIFSDEERFSVSVTQKPDTLKMEDFEKFDVVLSNWNSWPENDVRWSAETEQALSRFIKNGGGFVTFHASTSTFYEWPEFKEFTTSPWLDETKQGKNSATEINITESKHPIIKGLADFFIFDELWINAEKNKKFQVLGTAINSQLKEGEVSKQPAIMVSNYGKGRIFHTILGHDARAMRNSGFRALLQRGTEWAATGIVRSELPQGSRQSENEKPKFNWFETDTTLALLNGEDIVWQYNFRTKHGRPFFHPVFVGRNNLTCVGPDDHPWHLGQWFCWKYINKVNYWEYHREPYQSEGITEVKNVEIKKNPDYSAEINLDIDYFPFGGENVMSEKRLIKVSPPQENGKIWMNYNFSFKALVDEVELNRTPILDQENGVSWGGYAGLSIRFNQDFMNSRFITSWQDNDSINSKDGDWLYMGFTGVDGQQVGSQIMINPDSRRTGSAWYSVNTEAEPFYYVSPAYLYKSPVTLKKGDTLTLNYRILHMQGETNFKLLNNEFNTYLNQ